MEPINAEQWLAAGGLTADTPISWWAPLLQWMPRGSHLVEFGAGTAGVARQLAQTSMRYQFSLVDFQKDLLKAAWLKFKHTPSLQFAKVDYWERDVLTHDLLDVPRGDVCYSIGLLEHFEDDEIVTILTKMKGVCPHVVNLVPNADCQTYMKWKADKIAADDWPYGKEDAKTVAQMADLYNRAGISVLETTSVGDTLMDLDTDERYMVAVYGGPL